MGRERKLEKKAVSGIVLMLLLTNMLILAFNIQPVKAMGGIIIRADGTVDPSTAPILRDGDVYTFTDNILGSIVVERSNIIVDGNGYTLQGSGSGNGFQLDGVNNVTIQNVNIQSFATAIDINNSSYNLISGNILTDNGGFMGSVILESPYHNDNNTFLGNTMTNNSGSCLVLWGCYDAVSENVITNNSGNGISLEGYYITVSENILTNNTGAGITIYSSSNKVFGNNITNNTSEWLGQGIGILLDFGASDNDISGNIIADNKVGILLGDSSDNTIAQNDIINNTNQTSISNSVNSWDNGSEGNYWSDYNGTDSDGDGIGDTPYIIDENNQDNYPLIEATVIPEFQSWALILFILTALAVAVYIYIMKTPKTGSLQYTTAN